MGCIRNFRHRDRVIGRWKKNHRGGVRPCSEKVEPGYFLGPDGGMIQAFEKFHVGLDFDITMEIKPRNISGLLLAIQARNDYLLLQMVDGTMTFTVNNGRGPITAVFKPSDQFQFCDGKWHNIHGKSIYIMTQYFFLLNKAWFHSSPPFRSSAHLYN